jgi:peptidoglycan/LPS O-acetylase OafA/YrhL
VAVLAVLINHLNPAVLPGGYLGVDLFFVISGAVVTGSLLAKPAPSPLRFLAGFYARRFRRLLPALLLNIVVVALLFSALVWNVCATRQYPCARWSCHSDCALKGSLDRRMSGTSCQ